MNIEKDPTEILDPRYLTTEAKAALLKTGNFDTGGYVPIERYELESLVEKELENARNLRALGDLGIGYEETMDGARIRKSRLGNIRDFLSIIFGILLSLFIPAAVMNWKTFFTNEIDFLLIVGCAITTFFAALGIMLIFKAIDRILHYNRFFIEKSPKGITLVYRPDLKKETILFGPGAKLQIEKTEGEHLQLIIVSDETKTIVLKFPKLNILHRESLFVLADKFNSI